MSREGLYHHHGRGHVGGGGHTVDWERLQGRSHLSIFELVLNQLTRFTEGMCNGHTGTGYEWTRYTGIEDKWTDYNTILVDKIVCYLEGSTLGYTTDTT